MIPRNLVLHEDEFQKVKQVLSRLLEDTGALLVVLVDRNGQQVAAAGDRNSFETASLGSLAAGHVAASDGLARLIGEKEFSVLVHEGEKENIHIAVVARQVLLVVVFDQRASVGLVRLRAQRAASALEAVFHGLASRPETEKLPPAADRDAPFSEITDEDIDRLFSE
jgi:predicted regulator of Ras-like GTPase activity (Roadblock/LC7/MglB family)